ncbi:MAG: hypothetical protein RMJ46_04460 [Bacteroidota bacterium]|nr:hypothetical protein [Bacteroidota bacterium]
MQQFCCLFLLGCLFWACRQEPVHQAVPTARPPHLAAQLPPAYDTLPRLTEAAFTIGDSTFVILPILLDSSDTDAWLDCVVDSIVILVSTPIDTFYRPFATLRNLSGYCLERPNEESPVIQIEPIAGGQQHVLLIYTWAGGNSNHSFGVSVWTFPELRRLTEVTGMPRTVRLSMIALVLVAFDSFLPQESEDVPHALWASVATIYLPLDPTVTQEQRQQLWLSFLEQERQRALRAYDSTLRHFDPGWDEGKIVWHAITYILYSRRLGKTKEAQDFLRRELPRLQRTGIEPSSILYIRSALRAR